MRSVFASPRLLDYRAFGAYGEKAAHNAARRRRIQILMKACGCDRPMVIILVSKAEPRVSVQAGVENVPLAEPRRFPRDLAARFVNFTRREVAVKDGKELHGNDRLRCLIQEIMNLTNHCRISGKLETSSCLLYRMQLGQYLTKNIGNASSLTLNTMMTSEKGSP